MKQDEKIKKDGYWTEEQDYIEESEKPENQTELFIKVYNRQTREFEKINVNEYVNSFDDLNKQKQQVNMLQEYADNMVYEIDKFINERNIVDKNEINNSTKELKTKADELKDYVRDNEEELKNKGVK